MFVFGKHYGVSVGQIYENDFHKNIAYIIILGKTDDVTVIDKFGTRHTGQALLIKSMVEHTVVESLSVSYNIFLAPHSAFAASLNQLVCENGILKLPLEVLPFHTKMTDGEFFEILDSVTSELNSKIDHRLASVLGDLDKAPLKSSLADIAAQYDLSTSRLRVLAKEQIGVSLSTLFLWRKLVKSMELLSLGSTLSEAAHTGGFSDQAHFSRTMRKMLGITPRNSRYALS